MPGLPEDLERLLHDLRGPLNSAVIHLEVLRRSVDDDEARQTVQTIHEALTGLATMLPAAFEVVALEPGRLGPIDLRQLLTVIVEQHPDGEIALAEGSSVEVEGDERLLTLALDHLVRNALEASAAAANQPPAAQVAIEVLSGGEVDVVVRDRGAGLGTRRKFPRVLSSSKPGHRGVGLITAERVARLHGGRLRLQSSDAGTEVRLTLPGKR